MEISKVYQGTEQKVISPQSGSAQQIGENTEVVDSNLAVQKDFQVNVQDGLKMKLAEFANILQNREQLIQSLPDDIRKAVVELLGQMSADTELTQGLENLLKGQKIAAEQLKDMSNILEFSAALHQDEYSEIKLFLQKILENFTKQAEITPEQSAKELVQLAKQLPVSNTVAQESLSQELDQILEPTVQKNIQQLSQNEQKNLIKLTNLLGQNMPKQLQQLAKGNNLPELPGVWAIFKMADAWQFKDIQPKTLQAAVDLLNQIAQEMSHEKGTVVAKLEQFVQTLPPEVSNKGGIAAKLEQFVQTLSPEVSNKEAVVAKLEQFVQTLSSEASNKEAVVAKLEQFIQTLSSEVSNKGAVVAKLEQFVQTLSPEVSNKEVVVTQLEQFVQSLPLEVSNKGMVVAQLERFVQTLPSEIVKALQLSLKQGGDIADILRGFANNFSNAVVLNEHMNSEMQSLATKIIENMGAKSPSMPVDTNNILSQFTKQMTDTAATVEQLKTLIQQLKTQLFAGDPKLLEKQQYALNQLTTLFEQNIPQSLQEGAVKHKLPELPQMWVLLKSLGTEQWQDIEPQNLQKSASVIKELAQSIYKSTGLTGEKQAEHSVLSFSIPLHVAEGIYYPAHIHIYHQQKDNSSQPAERQFETWLRICVDTENIGMVDSVFRLYGDNKLDVRVNFSATSAATQFAQDLPNIKKSLDDTKLNLTDIIINKA